MKARNKGNKYSDRENLLIEIEKLTDTPLAYLSILWLFLIIYEFIKGFTPFLEYAFYILWFIFILEFFLELYLAEDKIKYLKRNWIYVISLFLPVFRAVRLIRLSRITRFSRVPRSVNLARLVSSLNKSKKALATFLGERGIGYLILLTVVINFSSAAGIYYFENPESIKNVNTSIINSNEVIDSYSDALWWSSMIITTIGSGYWPVTAEGRILAFLLALYSFAVFGYITAAIASYLIGKSVKSHRRK